MKSLARRLITGLLAAGFAGLCFMHLFAAPAPVIDFGRWHAVVVHSDDWGLEGWFPIRLSDGLREILSEGVPEWQSAYLSSTLESAADVDTLHALFASIRDLDGLPFVLQANTILAGPSVRAVGALGGPAWPVHASGTGVIAYSRPGLAAAVDRAIDAGVWYPELHGLTHFDLHRYAEARTASDPLAVRAAREGVFAYRGWRRDSELDSGDPELAMKISGLSVRAFENRFGRSPASVIAPDYRWGPEDERAWLVHGIGIVQAKREQVDRALRPGTKLGRVRKWVERQRFLLRDELFAVERSADLEPYGSVDPEVLQGAAPAARVVRRDWEYGRPGVVSVHRVQLVSQDPEVAAAGRAQLVELMRRLEVAGGVRFLLDTEVEQLSRRGWSRLERGPWIVERNWTGAALRIPAGGGRNRRPGRVLPEGNTVTLRDR